MLGKVVPFSLIPFWWTFVNGKRLQFTGNFDQQKFTHTIGDVKTQNFIVYSIAENDQVIGACGMGHDLDMVTIHEALSQNKMPRGSTIVDSSETPETIRKTI